MLQSIVYWLWKLIRSKANLLRAPRPDSYHSCLRSELHVGRVTFIRRTRLNGFCFHADLDVTHYQLENTSSSSSLNFSSYSLWLSLLHPSKDVFSSRSSSPWISRSAATASIADTVNVFKEVIPAGHDAGGESVSLLFSCQYIIGHNRRLDSRGFRPTRFDENRSGAGWGLCVSIYLRSYFSMTLEALTLFEFIVPALDRPDYWHAHPSSWRGASLCQASFKNALSNSSRETWFTLLSYLFFFFPIRLIFCALSMEMNSDGSISTSRCVVVLKSGAMW